MQPDPSSDPLNESSDNQIDDDALRSKLQEVGISPTDATLRYYREQVERHGLAAVLEGLERAAAHDKAGVRAYVDKCIASAATGENGTEDDAARRRSYIPDEYRDVILG